MNRRCSLHSAPRRRPAPRAVSRSVSYGLFCGPLNLTYSSPSTPRTRRTLSPCTSPPTSTRIAPKPFITPRLESDA
ncbi:hypothetical protein HYPSUDRAFT_1045504 [Hypholoma sublateritium FD-334 SS-4]|uniref:Uncharacterized protein n=1 Tax=Hypholoma sublateritium (strain FD-334 SS-4) TaxID=945553 RepID=A0A0D2M1B0_HYPSF|nr:hypothetical protein HYPSUDRAFT_1045504 [Hypholoma sublateritium FD-334 SS-4]